MERVKKHTAFHIHTYRCKHAGIEKEKAYIEKAMELGIEEIVFTDHCPFPGNPFRYRMNLSELQDYASTLQELKQKYVDQIDIRIGLETEYIPTYQEYYEELKDSGNYDLLLLGQHFVLLPEGIYNFESKDKFYEPEHLAEGMIQGMESGLFSVVAHPDLIFRRRKVWDAETEQIANRIKASVARTGVVLEKNIDSMVTTWNNKKKREYWPEFWAELPDGVRNIYGLDAHSTADLERNYKVQLALEGF